MPTMEERHATTPGAREGQDGSGTLRTPWDQAGNSHLPLVSAGLAHVGPGPSRTLIPLLQRPPDVTRHPHAWTATRIRAYPPRNSKSAQLQGAHFNPPDAQSPNRPGREALEGLGQPAFTAYDDSDLARPPKPADHRRNPRPGPVSQFGPAWPTPLSTPSTPAQSQPTQPFTPTSDIMARGPRVGPVGPKPAH